MSEVTVYSSPFCPYCFMAKKLLNKKGVEFAEIDVMLHPSRKAEMVKLAEGRTTVPQIFIDGNPVGGFEELSALDEDGRLDAMLANGK